MPKIDHYMVDYVVPGTDDVKFANDLPITSLTAAKTLARKFSQRVGIDGAYVVAFALVTDKPTFTAVGHIGFFKGVQDFPDGQVI